MKNANQAVMVQDYEIVKVNRTVDPAPENTPDTERFSYLFSESDRLAEEISIGREELKEMDKINELRSFSDFVDFVEEANKEKEDYIIFSASSVP